MELEYGRDVLRDEDSLLRVALDCEESGKRKQGQPKKTWKKQVKEVKKKIGIEMGWNGVQIIVKGME